MKITHDIQITLDLATVPVPDMEDPATIEAIKAIAMSQAERAIDEKHGHYRAQAKAARELREKSKGKE